MSHPLDHVPDGAKYAIDTLSFATALGTLAQVLPALASLLTIIWMTIRIFETKTMGRLIGRKQGTTEDAD